MIRINIIGVGFVDMAEGSQVAFKQDNYYFRFCDVSVGRSVEFTIPGTLHNRQLLGFADEAARYGEFLRRRYPCQVVYDGGCMDGMLVVSAYEGEAFKCAVTLGSSDWLESLLNLKLSDMVTSWTKGKTWDASFVDANAADLYVYPAQIGLVKQIRYERDVAGLPFMPAVNIREFLRDILTQRGVPHNIQIPREYWMVMPTLKGSGAETITIASTGTTNLTVSQVHQFFDVVDIDLEWANSIIFGSLIGGGTVQAKGLRPKEDVELTFPSHFPTGCFLVKWSSKLADCKAMGGVTSIGMQDPWGDGTGALDGRTVQLKKGSVYFFATKVFFSLGYYGYKDTYHPFSFSFDVVSNDDIAIGDTWQIRNNMPDMTLFEFVKSVALACGMELWVDAWDFVVKAATYGGKPKVCADVIGVDSVTRRVEAWGNDTHAAEVAFDSEDYVTQPIKWGYSIDSDQVTATKIFKAKFSEGGVGDNGILINDLENDNGTPKTVTKKITIAYADGVSQYLQRVPDVEMVGYEDIATESTCVRLRMRMGENAFFKLQPSDVWLWRGIAHVWTSASWSDGVLTLTLQKVSQPAIPSTP